MLHGLKEARERLGLSQYEAARRCDVSSSAYGRWEAGDTNPSPKNAEKLADGLVCTVDQLMSGFRPGHGAEEPPAPVTREEFEELRARVERLAERPADRRPSLYHDARAVASGMGLVDSHGAPVAAGCMIASPEGSAARRVAAVEVAEPSGMAGSGLATVTCVLDDGSRLPAVDMAVKGAVAGRAGR